MDRGLACLVHPDVLGISRDIADKGGVLPRAKASDTEGATVRTTLDPSSTECEFLTVKETARFLKVHEQTVYRKLWAGELPGVRVGDGWRIPRDELVESLKRGKSSGQDGSCESRHHRHPRNAGRMRAAVEGRSR